MQIPRRLWSTSLEKLPNEADSYKPNIVKYINNLRTARKKGLGLILYGENGSGKSALAAIIAREAYLAGFTVFWTGCNDYKAAVFSREEFDEYTTIVERAQEVDFLVIDDMGKEYRGKSEFMESEIDNLIRKRVLNGCVTIVTTNLKPERMKEEYTPSTISLFKEAMIGLKIEGPKWRDEISDQNMAEFEEWK